VVREPTVPIIPAQFRPPGQYSGATPVTGAYQPPVRVSYDPPAIPSQPTSGPYAPAPYLPTQYVPTRYPPAPYAPSGWPPPAPLLPSSGRRRRGRLLPAAAIVLALLAFLGVGGTAAMAIASGAQSGAVRVVTGPADVPPGAAPARDQALDALLTRRSSAITARDANAFMADVDRADAAFAKKQQTVYDNMTKLPLIDLTFKLNRAAGYDNAIPAAVRTRYGDDARAAAVSVSYRIEGVDDKPVAVPWVPIFAPVSGEWKLVGEATGKDLPSGVGGQAWDAGPIIVERSSRVVGVFSAGSSERGRGLVKLADQALDRLARVRSGQWVGKVFVVAVRDRAVFDAYFGSAPERVDQVAAIAVPHYHDVQEWVNTAEYSATRIIFNPDELSEKDDQLGDDLTHEFTHAAMAPVTTGWTPTWLVEGFAEYVSYKGANISKEGLQRALRGVSTDDLHAGEQFYSEPMNYITGWLACRMIAENYGEAKLIALYERFQTTSDEDVVVGQVLGIPRATLIKQWQEYVAKQRA
jgi:hypothetical protein